MRWIWLVFFAFVGCRSPESEVAPEVRALREEMVTLARQVLLLEVQIEDWRETVARIPEPPDRQDGLCGSLGKITPPLLHGHVLMVSDEVKPGLVSINLGTDHGVERGYTYEIYLPGRYKGRVRVINVQSTKSTAIVERRCRDRAFVAGDLVATEL